MRRRLIILLASVAGITLLWLVSVAHLPANDQEKPAGKQLENLKQRVELLEARVRALEHLSPRIQSLESRIKTQEQQPRVVTVPPTQAPSFPQGKIPPGWNRKEINGIPYYIVPLDTPTKKKRD